MDGLVRRRSGVRVARGVRDGVREPGVFDSVSRNELKELIDSNGGKVVSSISAKTSFLLAGSNMGPSKRSKANSLKVPIISEQEFLEML